MKKAFLYIILLLLAHNIFAQEKNINNNYESLKELTEKEKKDLQSLPFLKLPPEYQNKTIPYSVDNSNQIFYPGVFLQTGLSCGQAASVGIGFTYEINRVRNLDGSLIQNKYPTHFSYNWVDAESYSGGSYYHTFELLRTVGSPNMETYGGSHNAGWSRRWMTGYEAYYEAMHNRLAAAYAIDCSTEEGIQSLKHWIKDHLDGSETGGVGYFYSQHQHPTNTLPSGTENAGQLVNIAWGQSPNHAMSIIGYNDSIKWDYNGDGQYTNHLDINNDGIVDVRDWEIGAFKMNNTYGTPHYAWMMYKTLAEPQNSGGIWNNTVNVFKVLKDYSPALTYKINFYHTNRRAIKVMAGMSKNISADIPEYYLDFPIINFQGSERGMQGKSEADEDEESKHLEFGLDISAFLNYLEPGEAAKFFFVVIENHPQGWGNGFIEHFSIRDYSGNEIIETTSDQTSFTIIKQAVNMLSIVHTPQFSKPQIVDEVLPQANIYHPYSHQMTGSSGRSPYKWEFDTDYKITEFSGFDTNGFTTTNNGIKTLPFNFTFYGENYSSVILSNKGYIDFSGDPYDLPYNYPGHLESNTHITFLNRKCIAPFFSENTNAIAMKAGSDFIAFKWSSTQGSSYVKLNENGTIEIYYENLSPAHGLIWSGGISSGEINNSALVPFNGSLGNFINRGFTFTPESAPEYFALSSSGLITGTPTEALVNYNLKFKITDVGGVINRKTIPISSNGLVLSYDFITPNNDSLEWGETVLVNISLTNITDIVLSNLEVSLSGDNPNANITDNYHFVGSLNPYQQIEITSAFSFDLNYSFQNNEILNFLITASCDQEIWEIPIFGHVYTADIKYLSYLIDDGDNNTLDIGETTDFIINLKNIGGTFLENVEIIINSDDQYLEILNNTYSSTIVNAEEYFSPVFTISADEESPSGHVVNISVNLSADNGYNKQYNIMIIIGQVLEDWETGDFSSFNWSHSGNKSWFLTNEDKWEGAYSIRSGGITHNQESILELQAEVLSDGNISFYKKVSCEPGPSQNYDYLAFYIDGIEKGRWDGEDDWSQVSFPVSSGIRTFTWLYHKDMSVSSFLDRAWIDYIEFPSLFDPNPYIYISDNTIQKVMPPNQISTETLTIGNSGGGLIQYEIEILNSFLFDNKSQRSVVGSYITASPNYFYRNDTSTWEFMVYNASPDNEWLKQVDVKFPEGFEVIEISHLVDIGNDTLHVTGEPGFGAEFTFFGVTAQNWGLIVGGEYGFFNVLGYVVPEISDDIIIEYEIYGDIYGSAPHQIDSTLKLINYGDKINWLSIDINQGSIGLYGEQELVLTFNTEQMEEGVYDCVLYIKSDINEFVIPVELIVDNAVGKQNFKTDKLYVFPNPGDGIINIVAESQIQLVEVFIVNGTLVFSKKIQNNACSLDLSFLDTGTYILRVITENGISTQKIIINK